MASARIKNIGESWYHVVSRTAYQDFKFDDEAKSMFVVMLKKVAFFSGVDILNYCVMTNHFHILARVRNRENLSDEQLLDRIETLYGTEKMEEIREKWEYYEKKKMHKKLKDEQEKFLRRMWDISLFMQCLKQRYSIWFRHHNKFFEGTLWEGRFKSVIVQGMSKSLSAVSAYIDLNPVRAGMVKDPKDYKWNGYHAALAGDEEAQRGIAQIFKTNATAKDYTRNILGKYRELLYVTGLDSIDNETVKKVVAEKGIAPLPLFLRSKVRHFLRGAFIGTQEFIESEFQKHRDHFGALRQYGARKIKGCEKWQGTELCCARNIGA